MKIMQIAICKLFTKEFVENILVKTICMKFMQIAICMIFMQIAICKYKVIC